MKITSTDTTMQKIKKEIYIAMFGSNFVNVEKLVPAEDKKVEKILAQALTQREDEIRKEIEGIIGEDEPEKTNMLRSTGSPIIWDLALFRNQLRAEQRAVLAKLSKGGI